MPELDALSAISDDRDFEVVAKAVRDAIERNEPEAGLDRLHTFAMKYVRSLCAGQGIDAPRDKPLHSLFGEYLKRLREARRRRRYGRCIGMHGCSQPDSRHRHTTKQQTYLHRDTTMRRPRPTNTTPARRSSHSPARGRRCSH